MDRRVLNDSRRENAFEQLPGSLRDAQFTQHRLADLAASLFEMAALLSRITWAENRGLADDDERAVARLAFLRQEREFRIAIADDETPTDDQVARVAEGMTGLS